MKGVLPWLVRWACHAATIKNLSCLVFSSQSSTNFLFFTAYTIFSHLSQLPSKLGRRSCWVNCLLVCVSGLNANRSRTPQNLILNFKNDTNIWFGCFVARKNTELFHGSFVPTLQCSSEIQKSFTPPTNLLVYSYDITSISQIDSFQICVGFQEPYNLRSEKISRTDQKKVYRYTYRNYVPTASCIHSK